MTKTYLVGGSVRDMILGVESRDYDFVVVGASPEDFKHWDQVGKDFPIFLEPTHGWEVALARIERKVGVGYTGFETEWNGVTLEQDLARRDLTMNAMCYEVDFGASVELGKPVITGELIDPFNGQQDIKDKCLRHTTEAFSEDPVRVLRVARFLARYGHDLEWYVHDDTCDLCYEIYKSGELDNLTPERVWLEMVKAMSEKTPSLFFDWINFTELFPFIDEMIVTEQRADWHPEIFVWEHSMQVMDYAAKHWGDPEITFAAALHDAGKPKCQREDGNTYNHDYVGAKLVTEFCDKWKVPNNFKELAIQTAGNHTKCHNSLKMRPIKVMELFERTKALTHTERFEKMLRACIADARGRTVKFVNTPYPQYDYLMNCLKAVKELDTKPISAKMLGKGKSGISIGEAIRRARVEVIAEEKKKWYNVRM